MSDAFWSDLQGNGVVSALADVGTLALSLQVLKQCTDKTQMQVDYLCSNGSVNRQIESRGLHRNGAAAVSLLERARACIETHADDEAFSVERLATALHMSRASLHRKLVACVGLAPGDYIRQVRLQMAHRMLCECEDSVSAVAYAVGFETLSGFSRAFSAQFGIAPSRCRGKAD